MNIYDDDDSYIYEEFYVLFLTAYGFILFYCFSFLVTVSV